MQEAEFDRFAEEYAALHAKNIGVSGETPEFFAAYKIADTAELLAEKPYPVDLRILDFGSGVGASVEFFRNQFPSAALTCLDVSEKSLEVGRARFGDTAQFVHFDGVSIPFPNASFELVFAACVFHHIDHTEHVRLLSEVRRVLVKGGMFVVFEHNPLNPLTVHAVNTCEFDENAELIRAGTMMQRCASAGFSKAIRRYRIFFPGVLRRLRPLERYLRWLPLGAQYCVAAEK